MCFSILFFISVSLASERFQLHTNKPVLLGVELQIPIDVGELRLHPLSQSSWNYMVFFLAGNSA